MMLSARSLTEDDPAGAFQMVYDAARKACSALLAVQGLRATSRGGHIAVRDAARAQFGQRPGGHVLRGIRSHASPAQGCGVPQDPGDAIDATDVRDALPKSKAIVEFVAGLLPDLEPW